MPRGWLSGPGSAGSWAWWSATGSSAPLRSHPGNSP